MPLSRRSFLARALQPSQLPNIVLIYCDDLGYGDLGCYGSRLRTPHLDRLAAEGARFTHFYSANPVCSPSRAALLTGRYPTRTGVPRVLFPQSQDGLELSETTIAALLKAKGYKTMCIGKWHLGHQPAYLPTARGFDQYFGIPYSNDMNPRRLMRDRQVLEEQATLETLTPRYTEEAVKFIEGAAKQPFFLYFPHTYPHIPLAASDKFRGKSPNGLYGDVIEEIDWSVGQIVETLKRQGLERNTLILFSSDNGPWFQGSPGPLRGRKGSTQEGGVRVPFIARWPGHVKKGLVTNAVASTLDILPTIAKLTGATLPTKPLDGIDLWPVLSGQQRDTTRDALLYFDNWDLQCARLGRYKLHVARYNSFIYGPAPTSGRVNLPLHPPELYDLLADPDESFDIAAQNPGVVQDIQARIEKALPTFPDPVRKAWADTQARRTRPHEPGRLPIAAP